MISMISSSVGWVRSTWYSTAFSTLGLFLGLEIAFLGILCVIFFKDLLIIIRLVEISFVEILVLFGF